MMIATVDHARRHASYACAPIAVGRVPPPAHQPFGGYRAARSHAVEPTHSAAVAVTTVTC